MIKLQPKTKIFLLCIVLALLHAHEAPAVTKSIQKSFGNSKSDKALVYLIRQRNMVASLRTQFVYADQNFLATLDNNTYTYVYLEPGQHLIWTNWTSVQKQMEFIVGQTYYLNILQFIEVLDPTVGNSIIRNSISHFATPTQKEIKTASKHIAHRYGRAFRKMKKEDYAPQPASLTGQAMTTTMPSTYDPTATGTRVPTNTSVKLKLLENVTSFYSRAGDEVLFEVANDVVIDGQKVIREKTPVMGQVNFVSDGKTGGFAGSLDVAVSSLKAVDGSQVPLVGQIHKMGTDRTGDAVTAQMMAGLVGFLTVKRRQAYLLAHDYFEIKTKTDVWVQPNLFNDDTMNQPESQNVPQLPTVQASTNKIVLFKPDTKKNLPNINVKLPHGQKWSSVQLVAVDGYPVKPILPENKISKKDAEEFIFGGWDTIRYLPLSLQKSSYNLELLATRTDGQSYRVQAPLSVRVKIK